MKPKFFVIIALVAALVAATTAQANKGPLPPPFLSIKLSKAVSAVVDPDGVEVHIWCAFDVDPWSTLTNETSRDAWVSAVRCTQAEALARGLRPRVAAKREFAQALGLLLRAANMAVGVQDLDIAKCKSAQQVEFLAEEFGVGRAYARDLADLNWRFGPRPTECRPSGPLDFHLGRWPRAAYLPDEGKG